MNKMCPHCNVDLQDGEYSRVIGHEVPHVYDGVLFWQCPDCGDVWHRFRSPEMQRKAEPYMREAS